MTWDVTTVSYIPHSAIKVMEFAGVAVAGAARAAPALAERDLTERDLAARSGARGT
jgi:hypothetical protein